MEIKLIKNFEVGVLNSLNENLIIHVVDDNRQLDKFNGKRIYSIQKRMSELKLHQKYRSFLCLQRTIAHIITIFLCFCLLEWLMKKMLKLPIMYMM